MRKIVENMSAPKFIAVVELQCKKDNVCEDYEKQLNCSDCLTCVSDNVCNDYEKKLGCKDCWECVDDGICGKHEKELGCMDCIITSPNITPKSIKPKVEEANFSSFIPLVSFLALLLILLIGFKRRRAKARL